jgi:hypothetical protein
VLAPVFVVEVAREPPEPLLEALAALVGSEEHEATNAPPRAAARAIDERARRVTRRA